VRWSPEYIFKRRHLSASYTQFAGSSKLYTNSKSSWEFSMGTNVRLGIYAWFFGRNNREPKCICFVAKDLSYVTNLQLPA
jgi:hypothetical protein